MTNWFRGSCVGIVLGAALLMTEGAPIAQQPPAASAPTCQPAGAPARGGQPGGGRAAQAPGQQGAQAPGQQGAQAQAGRAGARAGGGGGTPPPIQWAAPSLPDGPITIQSATPAHRNLRLVVTKGLFHPWGMAFLPDGGILITERPGCLRIVRNGVLDPKLVAGLPPISAQGLSGLMDIALHPRFAENKFVYLGGGGRSARTKRTAGSLRHARARYVGRQRADQRSRADLSRRDDGSVAHCVRFRRHDLHEPGPIDGRRKRALAGPEQLRRQAAAAARRWHGACG